MKILEVKHIHKKDNKWVVPVVRETQSGGTIMQFFEHGFYQSAKRQFRKFIRILNEEDGLYIPKKLQNL